MNFGIPETMSTERPDKASEFLLQGRVVIIVNGSPCAIILPATLIDFMTSPEDAKIYFDSLEGDVEKEYILYDNSAHYPHFGEKEKFYEWMVEKFK